MGAVRNRQTPASLTTSENWPWLAVTAVTLRGSEVYSALRKASTRTPHTSQRHKLHPR